MKTQLSNSSLIKFRLYQRYFSSIQKTKIYDCEKKGYRFSITDTTVGRLDTSNHVFRNLDKSKELSVMK